MLAILREKRHQLAIEASLPAYVICHDRSLHEMATLFPQTETAFANIHGIGRAKVRKYAGDFLPLIRDYCAAQGISLEPVEPLKPIELRARTIEVYEAYDSGESVEELSKRLGITPRTIVEHLWRCAQTGRPLRVEGLQELSTLSPDGQEAVLACFASLGPNYLRPVFDALDGAVPYDELHVLRLLFVAGQSDQGPATPRIIREPSDPGYNLLF
jgi:ATP-dependent DNA helicase RecQ